MRALKKASLFVRKRHLSTFSTDAASKLDVLGHDGDTLGMDGAQVGVLKETNQVSLRGFLESHDSRGLETQVSLEVLGNLTDKTLEGQLADEKLSGLLVTTDLTESDCAWAITMGLLDSSCGRGRFAGSLGGQLLPWGLASSGFASGLLGTCHCKDQMGLKKISNCIPLYTLVIYLIHFLDPSHVLIQKSQ